MVQRCVSVAPEPDRELPVQYLNTELGAENAALLQSALAPNPGMWLLSLRGLPQGQRRSSLGTKRFSFSLLLIKINHVPTVPSWVLSWPGQAMVCLAQTTTLSKLPQGLGTLSDPSHTAV